jgi:SAM-dependent methyltransferase
MARRDDPAETWDGVAAAWDASVDYVNDHMAAATDALIEALAVRPGERVVELAGGPGTLGARWSSLVGAGGTVVVSDVAPAMVEAATRRLAPFGNVTTACLDLTAVDLPDASADVVACRFGLMFVPEPAGAVAEIRRILAPGGRLGVMTWAGLEHNPWVATVGMAAMVNGITAGGPPVGPGELFSLADPDALAGLAADAGFEAVAVQEAAVDFRAPDVDTHVDRVAALAGPLAKALEAASDEQVAALRSMVADGAAPFATDGGYVFPGRALLLTATRP